MTIGIETKRHLEELHENIADAMKKLNVKKETDLCYYLPGKNGKLHHLAFLKLKKSAPTELLQLIKEHVLMRDRPEPLSSLPKSQTQTKKVVEVQFRQRQINRILKVLKNAGEEDLIPLFTSHLTLEQAQKLMIDMVRSKKANHSLWQTYVELLEKEKAKSSEK